MGGSSAHVAVYAVVDGTAGKVRDELLEADFGIGEQGVRLGQWYASDHLPVGDAEDVALRLAKLGATFRLHQDSSYETSGEVYWHTPTLGLYRAAACGDEGAPRLDVMAVRRAVARVTNYNDLRATLAQLTGDAWDAELAEAARAAKLVRSPLPVCDGCGAAVERVCDCTHRR